MQRYEERVYEGSEDEGSDDVGGRLFIVRPLVWRNEKVTKVFKQVDNYYEKNIQKKRGRDQTVKRRTGLPSQRKAPSNAPNFILQG